MKLIWATRGRTWGYRFLLDGGHDDPLPVYDQAFAGVGDHAEVCRRVGDVLALRFADPAGRRDSAGRIISHDFVVFRPAADVISTVDDGRRLVWSVVANDFARDWELPQPTSTRRRSR